MEREIFATDVDEVTHRKKNQSIVVMMLMARVLVAEVATEEAEAMSELEMVEDSRPAVTMMLNHDCDNVHDDWQKEEGKNAEFSTESAQDQSLLLVAPGHPVKTGLGQKTRESRTWMWKRRRRQRKQKKAEICQKNSKQIKGHREMRPIAFPIPYPRENENQHDCNL